MLDKVDEMIIGGGMAFTFLKVINGMEVGHTGGLVGLYLTLSCFHEPNILTPHRTGASCSKLTTSLVNVSLKFQTLILQIHCYFLLKSAKDSHIFSTKNKCICYFC